LKLLSKHFWAKAVVLSSALLMVADMIYLNTMGISQTTHANCFIALFLPEWAFSIYQYTIEYLIVIITGIFLAVLAESYLKTTKRFFPKNQIRAFLYASLVPICSCGAVPLIEIMKNRVPLRVIITFIIAAPLLNPYIVMVSFTMLGLQYTVARIVASLILAIGAGLIVGKFAEMKQISLGNLTCEPDTCEADEKDLFVKTIQKTRKLLPYLAVGAVISLLLAHFKVSELLTEQDFNHPWLTSVVMMLIGIPLYVCNGADVILLKPLMMHANLTLGPAIVFSLTSSAVCVSSIALLYKFLGARLTLVLVTTIALLSLLIGICADFL